MNNETKLSKNDLSEWANYLYQRYQYDKKLNSGIHKKIINKDAKYDTKVPKK